MSLWTPNRTLTKTDHQHLMDEAERVGVRNNRFLAQSVVEFGPGHSTFAFIEAGVPEIVGLEHDPEWFDAQKDRFKDYEQVKIDWYYNEAPIAGVPAWVSSRSFDMAFVDSPKGYAGARVAHPGQEDCSRLNTCLAALKLAPTVLLHDAIRPLERGTLSRLEMLGHKVEWIDHPLKWKQFDQSYGLARIIRDGKIQKRSHLSGAVQSGRTPARASG